MVARTLSRWTIRYFAVAIAAFLIAQTAMVAGWAYPALPVTAPASLAVLHLLTIGWLTVLILGALQQFAPMVTGDCAQTGLMAVLPLGAIIVGLAGMVAGFLSLAGALPAAARAALPAGGLLVLFGMTVAAATLAWPLWKKRPTELPVRFILGGLGFLLATGSLGVLMAAILACSEIFHWPQILGIAPEIHAAGGLIGWCTLTAIGASYRLIAMFISARDGNGRLGRATFVVTAGGLTVIWLAGLALIDVPALQMLAVTASAAILALGSLLYLADMARLYHARRRALELHSWGAVASLAALGLGTALLTISALGVAPGRPDDATMAAIYLLVFGWLSGLALSQLYKLVPFLTWLRQYGHLLGKASVPSVDHLTNPSRAASWFALYFAAVTLGTGCGLLAWPVLWRLAVAMHLLATLGIVRELWRSSRWESMQAPVPEHMPFADLRRNVEV